MKERTKVYVITGEASGDLHGANMISSLLKKSNDINIRYWGGDKIMEVTGKKPVKHIKDLAFMGFLEVIMNLRTILGNISFCKKDIEEFQPDILVLIDYPGFNMRIAEWAKERGIKIFYYISPQIWAWKQNRVHKIKRIVDHMCVILPFEKDFYARFDCNVEYVGHPLLDEISKHNFSGTSDFSQRHEIDDRPILAILPGSRKQEVKKKLPIMMEAVKHLTSHQIIIAGAPTLSADFYQEFNSDLKIIHNETYELLSNSDLAIVTSGTATLETALYKVPQVVCYKSSQVSYSIAKRLIKVKYISLVNLIMDKEVVKELIQAECNAKSIRKEINLIRDNSEYRKTLLNNYNELEKMLGGGGASEKVAQSLLNMID